jgi:hypothetical protein
MVIRSAVVLLLLVTWSPACSRSDGATAARRLESDRYDLDLGQLDGTPVTRSVVLKSTGQQTVTIDRIGTFSGSITTRLKSGAGEFQVPPDAGGKMHFELPPGQTVLLEITVDSKTLTELHGRRITVHSNDSVEPTLSLSLSMAEPTKAALVQAAAAQDNGPPPRIAVSQEEIDFGELFMGEVPKKIIELSNKGEGDLRVQKIHSSCGCTAVRKVSSVDVSLKDLESGAKEMVLKPGEETDIEISLDTSKMKGPLQKEVRVESNDTEHNPLLIVIKAKALKPVELQPERLTFGRVVHFTTATQSTVLTPSPKLKDFAITNIVSPQPWIKVAWNKVEDEQGQPPKYKIDVTLTSDAPVGLVQDPLTVQTTCELVREFPLAIGANVLPPITFDTLRDDGAERIDFGVLKGQTSVTREVHIKNAHAETPYLIKSVEIESAQKNHFTSELVTKTEGQEYVIRISTKPSLDARYFKGWLVLKSEYPDLLEKRIPFQGWVTRS